MMYFSRTACPVLTKRDKRNVTLNIISESLWGFQAGLVAVSTVLALLLRSYGASDQMIGGVSAIEMAGVALPQILGAYIFTSLKNRKRDMVFWQISGVCPILLIMSVVTFYAPQMPQALYRWIMLSCLICFIGGIGAVVAVHQDWLAHMFHVGIRGRVMGYSSCGMAVTSTIGALGAGWLINHLAVPQSYAWLYLTSFVCSVAALGVFVSMADPAENEEDIRVCPETRELLREIGGSLKHTNFQAYLIGRILATCGFCILPFIAIYYASEEGGRLNEGSIVSCGAGMAFSMSIASVILGKLGDAFGHRFGVLLGAVMQMVCILVLILFPGVFGCIVAYFAAGFCGASVWVSQNNILIETCPHDSRVAHISTGNLVVGICAVAASLLAGIAADRWGMLTLFKISLAFSLAAFLWFLLRMREPRENRPN